MELESTTTCPLPLPLHNPFEMNHNQSFQQSDSDKLFETSHDNNECGMLHSTCGPDLNILQHCKSAFYAKRIFVYRFEKEDGCMNLGFWDHEKVTKQYVPGYVVDIKGNDEICALLTRSHEANHFNVFLVNDQRQIFESIIITGIQPFCLVLTDSTVCSIASNAVHIWKYKAMKHGSPILASDTGLAYSKNEKLVHLDEDSESDHWPGPGRKSGFLDGSHRTVCDPAVCADGVNLILVVGRKSGKIIVYSLPFGKVISKVDAFFEMGIGPCRIFVNSNGTQIVLIDKNGILSTCKLTGQSSPKIFDKRDVRDVMWAKDNPDFLCIMEQTNLHVIQDWEIQDTIRVSSHACLIQFRDLQITAILMNELMRQPESPPTSSAILKFDTKTLRELKYLISHNAVISQVQRHIEKVGNSSLWPILGQYAVQRLDFEVAEMVFVKGQDYAGIQLLKKVKSMATTTEAEKLIQQALIAVHYEDFHYAEKLYLDADRSDLAIKMWSDVEDWENLKKLYNSLPRAQQLSTVKSRGQEMYAITKGDQAIENLDVEKAIIHYGRGKKLDRVMDCAMILEMNNILEDMKTKFPNDESITTKINDYMNIWVCN